ncbi:P-type conjugative transfer protein TrbG [uncultured Novosphingobium sp.]|uniref:P-type conjugative transfer protein TrbG n=1 Tax=uncultured Novosphingobium sp. TaxID=292277 RepID=UPI002586F8B5|nr:P-type conjugative transfer protein TrbG [uncultured Novosphingobium sp.]
MIIRSMLFPIVALACVPAQAHEGASPLRRVAVANRSATEQPAAQGFINATQVYAFSEGMIFQGYTAPGAVTDIALQPGEALVAVASGDTARWVIGDTTSGSADTRRTHILVKPFNAGLITNLVITTDRRTYHLRLASTARTPMAAISWTYPQDELLALKRQAEAARFATPVAAGIDVDQLRFDYAVSGDRPAWRPLRAFDDGQKTYIEFPSGLSQGEAPPLFVLGADGKAELANYRVRERYYIIDRLFDVAELRLGLKKQQVVRITRGARAKHRRGA